MVPSDVPPSSSGRAPRDGEERVRALLSRAVEEQASEQRALSDALIGLQQRVEAVAAQLRLAASGEAVGGGLAQLGRQLQGLQGELDGRLGAVAAAVAEQADSASAGWDRLSGLAGELQASRTSLDALRDAVGRVEPQLAGLHQLVVGAGQQLGERLSDVADQQTLQAALGALRDLPSRSAEQVAPRLEGLLAAVRALPQTADLRALVEALLTAVSARLDRLDAPLDDLLQRAAGDVLRPELDALGAVVRGLPVRLDALATSVGGLADRQTVEHLLAGTARCDDVESLLTDVARRADLEALLRALSARPTAVPDDVERAARAVLERLAALAARPALGPADLDGAVAPLRDRLDGLADRTAVEQTVQHALQQALADLPRRDDVAAAAAQAVVPLDARLARLEERPALTPSHLEEAVAALLARLPVTEDVLGRLGAVEARVGDVGARVEALPATVRDALRDGVEATLRATRDDVAALRSQVQGLEGGVADGLTRVVQGVAAATGRLLEGMPDDALLRRVADAMAGPEQTVEQAVGAAAGPGPAPTGPSGDDLERLAEAVLQRVAPALVQSVADAVHRELAASPAPPPAAAVPTALAPPVPRPAAARDEETAAPVPAPAPDPVVASDRAPRAPRPAVTTAVAPPVHRR